MPQTDRELDLLLCCAAEPEPRVESRIRKLLADGLDGERLLRLAWRHAMTPLLAHRLERTPGATVPDEVHATLRYLFARNGVLALRTTRELLSILRAFDEADILALPYKGPVLAQQLYGNVALRQVGDLDILVSKSDFRKARELLVARGYGLRGTPSPEQEQLLLKVYCNQVLDLGADFTVELHWRFTNDFFAFPLDLETVAPRLRRMRIGGADVPVLGREDLLLVLSVHGSKHLWDRLEWIGGVARLLRATVSMEWDAVLERARELGSMRMLLLGVLLAHDLLDGTVPDEVLRRARADRHVPDLATKAQRGLRDPAGSSVLGKIPRRYFQLRLMDRARDRLRFASHTLANPDEMRDWRLLRVGDLTIPLHALARPFQVAGKLGRRIGRGLRDRNHGSAE